MITLQEIFFCHCTSRQLAGPITTMVVCVMKLVPILVILVVLCGFLALEGQAKKVKKQHTKVRFGKISSGRQLTFGSENQSKIPAFEKKFLAE